MRDACCEHADVLHKMAKAMEFPVGIEGGYKAPSFRDIYEELRDLSDRALLERDPVTKRIFDWEVTVSPPQRLPSYLKYEMTIVSHVIVATRKQISEEELHMRFHKSPFRE